MYSKAMTTMDPGFFVDYEGFFSQLLPLSEQDHRIMSQISMAQNIANYERMAADGSFKEHSRPGPSHNFLPSVVDTRSSLSQLPSPASIKDDSESPESDDKQKSRRANQNLACRNYRRRKKEYVQELEGRISKLESENEQLKRDNSELKKSELVESVDPNVMSMLVEIRQIIVKLQEAVAGNLDDKSIAYLLQLLFLSLEKRNNLSETELDKLVNPFTQAKLASFGYSPSQSEPGVTFVNSSGDKWWSTFMAEGGITDEQIKRIQGVRDSHLKFCNELLTERRALDKSIKEFYLEKLNFLPHASEKVDGRPKLDMAEVMEFSRKLASLKKNFMANKVFTLEAHGQLSKILTPRQHAILFLKMSASGSQLDGIRALWAITNTAPFQKWNKTNNSPAWGSAPVK